MLPKIAPPIFTAMTRKQWQDVPKGNFNLLIPRWCNRHDFVESVDEGRMILNTRLPYHLGMKVNGEDSGMIYVAEDFLYMLDAKMVKEVFQSSLLP